MLWMFFSISEFADFYLRGSGGINGVAIIGGNNVSVGIEGGSGAIVSILYAPYASVRLAGGGNLTGAVIRRSAQESFRGLPQGASMSDYMVSDITFTFNEYILYFAIRGCVGTNEFSLESSVRPMNLGNYIEGPGCSSALRYSVPCRGK
jgi:hypothetical protein